MKITLFCIKVLRLQPFVRVISVVFRLVWSTGRILTRENWNTWERPVPVPLSTPHISHGLAQVETWDWQPQWQDWLTIWDMAWHNLRSQIDLGNIQTFSSCLMQCVDTTGIYVKTGSQRVNRCSDPLYNGVGTWFPSIFLCPVTHLGYTLLHLAIYFRKRWQSQVKLTADLLFASWFQCSLSIR